MRRRASKGRTGQPGRLNCRAWRPRRAKRRCPHPPPAGTPPAPRLRSRSHVRKPLRMWQHACLKAVQDITSTRRLVVRIATKKHKSRTTGSQHTAWITIACCDPEAQLAACHNQKVTSANLCLACRQSSCLQNVLKCLRYELAPETSVTPAHMLAQMHA